MVRVLFAGAGGLSWALGAVVTGADRVRGFPLPTFCRSQARSVRRMHLC
jgi:hypothetical protein